MRTIDVTARFEIRFQRRVTEEVFAMLEQGTRIDDVIDESEVYKLLATEGECEMDWDFTPVKKKKKRKKKK
jgi:hypothetical protein